MTRIFIDPGHGGSDPGATTNGLREKDVCLTIALKLRDILNQEYAGHTIKLSRTADRTLTLKERTDLANRFRADYLVSVHINAGGGTGFESYVYNGKYANKGETERLRHVIHEEIVKETRCNDRGKKEANFHMLRESLMPAVLTENGFIDTTHDANQLKDTAFLHRIARGHARGLAKAFGLQQKRRDSKDTDSTAQRGGAQIAHNHTLQQGDTLWGLAKQYHTTVDKLMEWNPGLVAEELTIGQKLTVEGSGNPPALHTIERGDTLWALGKKYHTTVTQLQKLNGKLDPNRLPIGKKIRVR